MENQSNCSLCGAKSNVIRLCERCQQYVVARFHHDEWVFSIHREKRASPLQAIVENRIIVEQLIIAYDNNTNQSQGIAAQFLRTH